MKAVNKILCSVLAFVIAFAQLPLTALAYNENVPSFTAEQTDVISEDGKWKYDIALDKNEEPRVWIKEYLEIAEAGKDFVFPSAVDGMRVQSVDMYPSSNLFNIKKDAKIVFEENIEIISGEFMRISQNLQVVLPSTLLMIDQRVLASSKNLTINFPEGLRAIGNEAFRNCTFTGSTDIVLPESVEFIGENAFSKSNITSVKIGAKAVFDSSLFSQTLGVYNDRAPTENCEVFANCSNLSKVEIDENNPNFVTEDGVVYTADKKELVFLNNNPSDYEIPDSVEYVHSDALNNKNFNSLLIPSSIQNFNKLTFKGTKIGKLNFKKDCAYDCIYTNIFKDSKIDVITIPKSIKTIESNAFYKCEIKKLVFEEGAQLTEIGEKAFGCNKIENLDLTNCKNLIKAKSGAFRYNELLLSVDMTGVPMDELSPGMFSGCYKLNDFKISEYTKIIRGEAFEYNRELLDVDLSNIAQCYPTAFRLCFTFDISDYILSSGTTEDGYEYNEFENHISLTGYTGESDELIIPDTINSKPVTDIAWSSDSLKIKKIKKIKLPSNLNYISSKAFENKGVEEINDFPKTLRFIGENAFYKCNFATINLNDGLEYVLSEAFQYCPFQSMVIPDSVLYYLGGMFNQSSVTFGKNVRTIKDCLDNYNHIYFENINIYISPENPYYSFDNGVLYNADKTHIYKYYTFYNVDEITDNYQIPETVKIIDENAFYEFTRFGDLVIPGSVEYIGKKAFTWSSVTSVHFANGVKAETLNRTFLNCNKLKRATFGNVDIKNLLFTFAGSAVENVDIPESVENITGAYQFTKLSAETELKLPEGLKTLGNWAFGYSYISIKELSIPKGVERIGYSAFSRCRSLEKVDFANVNYLSREAFEGCTSLESVDLTGITYFKEEHGGTFVGCSNLKKITFNREDRQHDIEDEANKGNTAIETVVIGNGINNVKSKAFADCKNLETAVISDSVESIADDAFENCNKLTIVCTKNSNAMLFAKNNNIKYKTFKINPVPDQEYTGKAIKPSLNVTVGESRLAAGKDYSVSYSNNINIGTAKAIAVGIGDYSIYGATVNFNIVHHHKYTAKTVKPTYEKAGYTVYTCICGKSYKGDTKAKLKVSSTSIKKLMNGKKSITVSIKKVNNVSGYQIQYSTSQSFKTKKTVSLSNPKTVKKTIKNLKSKKKYYVRIRAYKKVSNKTYFSSWSKTKSVKTK